MIFTKVAVTTDQTKNEIVQENLKPSNLNRGVKSWVVSLSGTTYWNHLEERRVSPLGEVYCEYPFPVS